MKKLNLIAFAVAAILLAACIPSVYPFYTDKDVIVDPQLFGEWQQRDDKDPEIWKFEQSTNNSMNLTVVEPAGKTGQFTAHLFQLKQEKFLDLIPSKCDYPTNQADLVAASMFPGHLLVHVTQIEPVLQMSFCDFDWLEKYLEKNPSTLEHHVEDHEIVLTADTGALQNFVLQHLGTNELFKPTEPGNEMVRRTNEVSSAGSK